MNLEQKKDVRFHFLGALYKLTDGKESKFIDYKVVGAQVGMDERAAFKVGQYLAEEGLLRFRSETGLLTMTHGGVAEVKASDSDHNVDSSHFAFVGRAPEPPTMQPAPERPDLPGAETGPDVGMSFQETTKLAEIIRMARTSMGRLELERQETQSLDADIRTIEAQLSSPRPRRTILFDALESMRDVLKGAAEGSRVPLLLAEMEAFSQTARPIES
jgi:hypothetical protein